MRLFQVFPRDTKIAKHTVHVVSRVSRERKRIWSSWSFENAVRAQKAAGTQLLVGDEVRSADKRVEVAFTGTSQVEKAAHIYKTAVHPGITRRPPLVRSRASRPERADYSPFAARGGFPRGASPPGVRD